MTNKLRVFIVSLILFSSAGFVFAKESNTLDSFMYEPKRIRSLKGDQIIKAPVVTKVPKKVELFEDEGLRSVEAPPTLRQKVQNKLSDIKPVKNKKSDSLIVKDFSNDIPPVINAPKRLNLNADSGVILESEPVNESANNKVDTAPSTVTNPKPLFFKDSVIQPIMLEARVDIPMELTLRQVLEVALKNNLDLILSQFDSDVKKWQWIENIGNFLPDFSAGISWRRFDGTFLIGGVFPVNTTANSANVFTRLNYEFFDGGKKLFNTLAARKLYQSAGKNYEFTVSEILLAVTKSYNNLLREQAKLNVLVNSVKEARENLKLNENLERRGVGTKFNVLQSRALLAEEEQALLQQQATFRQASVTLSVLLNLQQDNHIKPSVRDLAPKELFNIDTPINEIIKIAKENRADYKKLKLEYQAKRKLIAAAFSDYLPKANIYGEIGGTGRKFFDSSDTEFITSDAIMLDAFGNPVVSGGMVSNVTPNGGTTRRTQVDNSLMSTKTIGVEVNWNVGTGLGVPTLARIKQAKKEAQKYKIQLEQLENKIESEVRFAYLNVQSNNRLLSVAKERVFASKESLRLSKLRLVNGVGINTELLDSQTAYKEALSSKVNAIVEYNNSQVDLLHKLGVISVETILPEQNKIALNY